MRIVLQGGEGGEAAVPGFFSFLGQRVSSMGAGEILLHILDILILALFLYVAIRFLWDRRAGKLILGIALLFAAYLLSRFIGLSAVGSVLEAVVQAGILVLIVIFQPELRDGLEKIGGMPLKNIKNLSDVKGEETVEGITAICEAVSDMSRTRTGALIVIERGTKLGDIIRSGVTIDGKLSSYLLRNIFFLRSPMHDGAVVIRNMRVCSAGCLLPLTRREDVDPNLGTRHRAALGMSEASDAVIVVVSEETGTVSLAYNRTLSRDFTAQTLKMRLSEILLNVSENDKIPQKSGGEGEKDNADE